VVACHLAGALAAAVLLQTGVPVEREPMHTVVFDNALVRVIDAAVPAGAATLYHTHERDNVPISVAAGRIAITVLNGSTVQSDVVLGQVSYALGGYTHEVRNDGDTPLRFIDVELTGARPESAAAAGLYRDDGSHRVEIENDRVVVRRRIVAARGTALAHQHHGPLLEVVVRGGPLTSGDLESRPGSFRWRADGRVPQGHNGSGVDFEVVEVEWKP
jgi:mannose-6-phosphate isomerase-like protein (cupin superfamily)